MIFVVLAAGYATRMYPLTENFPKPLLPVGGEPILTRLLRDADAIEGVSRHVIISNHRFYAQFKAWSETLDLKNPVTVLDDGSTDQDNRLGAVKDLQFAIESSHLDDDLLVVAGDNVLDFSLAAFAAFQQQRQTSAVMCYQETNQERLKKTGVMVPDADFRIVSMVEKPQNPPSEYCVPPFYFIKKSDIGEVAAAIESGISCDAPGSFIAYLAGKKPVYAMPMPGKRYDVGSIEGYEKLKDNPPV